MADTSLADFAMAQEASFGVLPGSPSWEYMRLISEGLERRQTTQQSQELNPLMQARAQFRTDLDISGPINVEMSFEAHDKLLIGVLRSSPTKTPEKAGTTEITSISGANTVNINSGGASYLAGMLIRMQYWPSSANNGIFKVASNTGTTIVITGGGLTNESSVARTRLKVCGVEGASADIVAVTAGGNGLTSTALDFTTLGLSPGQWLSIGGSTTGTKYDTAGNNGMVRLDPTKAVAANRLYFDCVPTGWAADAGAGKTIRLFFGDVIRNGVTQNSFQLSQTIIPAVEWKHGKGLVIGGGTINLALGAAINGVFTFDVGSTLVTAAADPSSGAAVAAPDGDIMNVVDNFDSVYVDNVVSSMRLSSISMRFANNPRAKKQLGRLGPWGFGRGTFTGGWSLEAYHEDATFVQRYENFTRVMVAFRIKDTFGGAYMLTMPRSVAATGNLMNPGQGQDFMDRFEMATEPDLTLNCHVQIDKLPVVYN